MGVQVCPEYALTKSTQKLDSLRKHTANAGGLIVASSVTHAQQIGKLLEKGFNEPATIVTYRDDNAAATIRAFKANQKKWIVSVGMISEGTNIPRLQVCCHLTRVKTELYFRQILGRILRHTGKTNEKGYLYLPAEPTLLEYARRLAEDIPQRDIVRTESFSNERALSTRPKKEEITTGIALTIGTNQYENMTSGEQQHAIKSPLLINYENSLDIFGRFRYEMLGS